MGVQNKGLRERQRNSVRFKISISVLTLKSLLRRQTLLTTLIVRNFFFINNILSIPLGLVKFFRGITADRTKFIGQPVVFCVLRIFSWPFKGHFIFRRRQSLLLVMFCVHDMPRPFFLHGNTHTHTHTQFLSRLLYLASTHTHTKH